MRILLVEDNPASIESAKMQFADHELTVTTSCAGAIEILEACKTKDDLYDFILTDMEIPVGNHRSYSAIQESNPESLLPGGLVIALCACRSGFRCLLLTDSNGHRSVMGLMINRIGYGDHLRRGIREDVVVVVTQPKWIETPLGKGKDWKASCPTEWIS